VLTRAIRITPPLSQCCTLQDYTLVGDGYCRRPDTVYGEWVDETHDFYGGGNIQIYEGGWIMGQIWHGFNEGHTTTLDQIDGHISLTQDGIYHHLVTLNDDGTLHVTLDANTWTLVRTTFAPADGTLNDPTVNARVRCGVSDEGACAAECDAHAGCVGYAYAQDVACTGRCFAYGPGMEEGLKPVDPAAVSETEWEGYSSPNLEIGATASNYAGIVCKRKAKGLQAYCDQERDGGGWMLLLTLTSTTAQYEGSVSPMTVDLNPAVPSPETPYSRDWNAVLAPASIDVQGGDNTGEVVDGRTEIRICNELDGDCIVSTIQEFCTFGSQELHDSMHGDKVSAAANCPQVLGMGNLHGFFATVTPPTGACDGGDCPSDQQWYFNGCMYHQSCASTGSDAPGIGTHDDYCSNYAAGSEVCYGAGWGSGDTRHNGDADFQWGSEGLQDEGRMTYWVRNIRSDPP
jgi:hypothetical protein